MLIYYVECAKFCICLMGSRPLVLFGLNFLPLCCLFQRWRKKKRKEHMCVLKSKYLVWEAFKIPYLLFLFPFRTFKLRLKVSPVARTLQLKRHKSLDGTEASFLHIAESWNPCVIASADWLSRCQGNCFIGRGHSLIYSSPPLGSYLIPWNMALLWPWPVNYAYLV